MDPINAANIERRVMNLENEVAKLREKQKADVQDNEVYELRASLDQEKTKRLKAEAILMRFTDVDADKKFTFAERSCTYNKLVKEAQNHLRILR